MREFDGGATRDCDLDKLDFEGFLSPYGLKRFAEYMHQHRSTAAGVRDSDNWQSGMPLEVYIKSAWRHFFAWWEGHRLGVVGGKDVPLSEVEDALCGLLFNTFGYLHQLGKGVGVDASDTTRTVYGLPAAGGDEGVREGESRGKVGAFGPRDRDYIGPGSGSREG